MESSRYAQDPSKGRPISSGTSRRSALTGAPRLVLAAVHMPALETMSDFVRKIVDLARQASANVKMVLLDREFFATDVMRTLDGMGVGYLTPCRKHRRGSRRP